jgi:hypothetical protein
VQAQERAGKRIKATQSPALLSGDQVEALLAKVEKEQDGKGKE